MFLEGGGDCLTILVVCAGSDPSMLPQRAHAAADHLWPSQVSAWHCGSLWIPIIRPKVFLEVEGGGDCLTILVVCAGSDPSMLPQRAHAAADHLWPSQVSAWHCGSLWIPIIRPKVFLEVEGGGDDLSHYLCCVCAMDSVSFCVLRTTNSDNLQPDEGGHYMEEEEEEEEETWSMRGRTLKRGSNSNSKPSVPRGMQRSLSFMRRH